MMAPESQRSAAMVVSVHFDREGGQRWFARISAYRDTIAPDTDWIPQTTVDGVCAIVRAWLGAVTKSELAPGDEPVTGR